MHTETYQKLTAPGGNWDEAVAYYKELAAAINYEIAARERSQRFAMDLKRVEAKRVADVASDTISLAAARKATADEMWLLSSISYKSGVKAGERGLAAVCPYVVGSEQAKRWRRGYVLGLSIAAKNDAEPAIERADDAALAVIDCSEICEAELRALAERAAMEQWQARAAAKAQHDPAFQARMKASFDEIMGGKAPFPAAALSGRVMRVGICYAV